MIHFVTAPGATPIEPGDVQFLLPAHIQTQKELDDWEATNIAKAQDWLSQRRNVQPISVAFVLELHRRMFDETWRWAGRYRQRETTPGCPPFQIRERLLNLIRDAETWIADAVYPPDEIAVRLHHDLVEIHIFENGNGRHARLYADCIVQRCFDAAPFTWGVNLGVGPDEMRAKHIAALQAADQGRRDYGPILAYARS